MASEKKTVIIAEDEVLTRMLADEVLSEAGYVVIQAEDADHALKILQSYRRLVHLLFTDIHMPGSITGLELAHVVRSHWPKVALVVTSGAHMPQPHELPAGGIFVAKPYALNDVMAQFASLIRP